MRRRLLLLAPLLLLGACRKETDEAKIHRLLDEGVTALEAGDVGDAMALVADDFQDDQGADKQTVKGILAGYVLRGNRITIVRRDEKVTVDGTTATATFDAALFQGDRAKLKGLVPQRSGTYRFTLTLRKGDDGAWLVTNAKYQGIPAASFLVNSIGD